MSITATRIQNGGWFELDWDASEQAQEQYPYITSRTPDPNYAMATTPKIKK